MKDRELWTRHEIKKDEEKRIITGMIIDDEYLRQISIFLKVELLELSYARKVARMCLDYLNLTEKAPRGNIEDMFQQALSGGRLEEGEASLIETFLTNLSSEFVSKKTKFNTEYEISQARNYLRRRALLDTTSRVKEKISLGNLDEAEKIIMSYNEVGKDFLKCEDILNDEDVIRSTFVLDDVLFKFPGALGQMMGWLKRGDFIAFTAPAKRGKSWWLMETAIKGMMAGCKVLFINLEMSHKEINRRFYQRILGEVAMWEKDKTVSIPYYDDFGGIGYRKKEKEGIKIQTVIDKGKSIQQHIRTGGLRILSEAAGGIAPDDLYVVLDNLEYFENFKPDIIIGDYADLMVAGKKYSDPRDQINIVWRDLRGLAQKRNCLLATASHSNKSTFNKESIEQSDIVEDIRKLNHVTSMFALNQTAKEKEENIMRVGTLGIRGAGFSLLNEVQVLQQLKIGKPYIDSKWIIRKPKNEKKAKK